MIDHENRMWHGIENGLDSEAGVFSCRILLVEDNEDDYLIVRDLLSDITTARFDLRFDLQWVDTYEAAREMLTRNRFDVCFLDYRLGEATGLELVREFVGLGTPFILLTGTEDYEVDVAAAKAGAADYLLKGHINVQLMERSIRYAIERQRSVAALLQAQRNAQASADNLKVSEGRYRRLFEAAKDGILILDAHSGKIEHVNPFLCELLGYAPDNFVGEQLWDIGTFRDIAANQEAFRALQQQEYTRYDDLPLQTKDGRQVFVEFVSNVYRENGHRVIQCNIRDISERKRAALAEQEWQRFLQSTLDALGSHIAVLDENGTIIAVNKAWRRFTEENGGIESSCGVGANYVEICAPAKGIRSEEAKTVSQGIQNVMAGQQSAFSLEYHCHSPTEKRWFNLCATRFVGDGPVRVVVAHENITERERAENLIRSSEANLAKAQQIAHLGSWELDLLQLEDINKNPLRWSDEVFRIFGYQPQQIEVTSETFFAAVHPDDRERIAQALSHAVHAGQSYNVKHRILLPDGGERIVHEQSETVFDDCSGKPVKMVGTVQDITEQTRLEESLHQERDFVSAVVDTVGSLVIVLDRQGRIVRFNRVCEKLTGYSFEDVKNQQFWDLFLLPDEVEAVKANFKELQSGQFPNSHENFWVTRNGGRRLIAWANTALLDAQGMVEYIIGTGTDITEQKQNEESLRQSSELLRAVTEGTSDAIYAKDLQGRYLMINSAGAHFLGCSVEEVVGKTDAEITPPEAAQTFANADHHILQSGKVQTHEETGAVAGVTRTYLATKGPLRDSNGDVVGIVGVSRDITERKEASEAMARLAAIVESSSDAIIGKTLDGIITSWNAGAQALYGYSPEEAIGRPVSVMIAPDRPQEERQLINRISRGEQVANYETVRVCKDGRHLDVSLTLSPVKNERGEIIGASAISRDISERKQSEAQMHFQKTLLEAQMEASLDGILVVSQKDEILSYNGRFMQMWGMTHADVAKGDDTDLRKIVLDQVANFQEVIERVHYLYEHRGESSHEELLLHDGRIFDRYSAPISSADGAHYGRVWCFRDITERKNAENALRASEERFQSIVANVPGMVYQFVAHSDGSVAWPFVSEGCREIYEVEPDIFNSNPKITLDRIHPEDRDEFDLSVAESARTLLPWSWEGRHRLESGKVRWIQGASRPQRTPDGGTLWNGLVMDITARKEAEEERDRFFTMSVDMLGIAGFDGYFKRLNPAFSETLGFSDAELMAVPFLEFVHPDDQAATLKAAAKLADGAQPMSFENRYRCRDGSYKWLRWMCAPFEELYYCVAHDITHVKQTAAALLKANDELELHVSERTAELYAANELLRVEVIERKMALDALSEVAEAFRATQEMLQSVMNHIPQAIFWKDRQSVYLGCNNRLAKDAGFDSPEEIPGKNDLAMPWAEHAADYRSDDALVMETDTPKLNFEELLTTAEGDKIWLRTNKVPLHDTNGHVVGVLASYDDVTLQKEAEAAIHQAREEAEAANLAKSEFLSRMSHELRTPMNAILGFGQILEMRGGDPKQRENVRQILKAGRHLLSLINEVLDIARIEAGHLSLSLEPISINTVVRETLDLVQPLAGVRQIELVNEVVGEIAEKHLLADQQRLKQVLLNLLSNAVKYNRDGGSVFVSCEPCNAPDSSDGLQSEGRQHAAHLRILVRDTGAGLSEEDISRLFVPFERLSAARTQIEGTGIGLTLCKRLVEAMNGRIGIQSEVGQGSTFWVELPLVSSPLERAALLESDEIAASTVDDFGTILYIEDNLSNINLIEQVLAEQTFEVKLLTAMQGSVGLELAVQHSPDLILLDVHLPDIMGDVVLQHLKADAKTRNIPVVVLSADATPSQVERLLEGGAENYLTKPLDLQQFLLVLQQFLGNGKDDAIRHHPSR